MPLQEVLLLNIPERTGHARPQTATHGLAPMLVRRQKEPGEGIGQSLHCVSVGGPGREGYLQFRTG